MRIEALIPQAGKADEDGLRKLDADVLARYVISTKRPWWRRRPCVLALRDRVPEPHVAALLERVRDPADVSEIRIALLDVLHDRAELLPWLREQTGEQRYGMHEAILKARAGLGDLSAAAAVATLANDLWQHRRAIGEAALDALVARHGLAAVQETLGDSRPEDRAFAVRMLSRSGGDVTPALADPDVGVARAACELAIATGIPDDEMLFDHVVTGPTASARLWAAYALHRRGNEICELWHAIERPRVEIAGLPDDIRLAILREYHGEAHTDPRWLVERVCVEPPPPPDERDQLARVVAALDAAGLAPQPPQSIGQVNQQGGGTYHVIEYGGGAVSVSNLGAFVTGDDAQAVRQVLERAGFRWIDAELGAIRVAGLCVYYFGHRDPLDVRTLLFYWQD